METSLKGKLSSYVGEFVAALLVIQPLLDVMSFFMSDANLTSITTVIRTIFLVTVTAYAFVISDKKPSYFLLFAVVVAFWLIHMANCARVGYAQPGLDLGEYAKLIQFPLWTLSFITFFKKRDGLNLEVTGLLAINMSLIILVIILSFATGNPVYTYDYPERGIQVGLLGWFKVANAQSTIVAMLVPAVLLWAYRKANLAVFCISSVLSFALLYCTGTRLTYFSAVIISFAFILLILINKKQLAFCIPLAVIFISLVLLYKVSPMQQRVTMSDGSLKMYQEQTDEIMGEHKDFVYAGNYDSPEDIPDEIYERIERVYTEVYGGKSISGAPLLGDMIERFGVERLMKVYKFKTDSVILYDRRTKHLKFQELVWEEQDILTKLFGYEYSKVYVNGNIYDAENDFPVVLYYYGYVGMILYCGFILFFVLKAFIAFVKNPRVFLTVQMGTALIMFVLAIGAAQYSGQVLRKPSVTVYFSLAAAMIYTFASEQAEKKVSFLKGRPSENKEIVSRSGYGED